MGARDPGFDSPQDQSRKPPQLKRAKVCAMATAVALWKRKVLGSTPSGTKSRKTEHVETATTKEMAKSGLDALLRSDGKTPQFERTINSAMVTNIARWKR